MARHIVLYSNFDLNVVSDRRAGDHMAYDREAAVAYAQKWAYGRNPAYLDFHNLGGDCTNFASQVLHAGGMPMDFMALHGWYYIDSVRRAAAWSSVEYLYRFLIGADTHRPRATLVSLEAVRPGDIVQLSYDGVRFNHSPVVVEVAGSEPYQIYLAAHTIDAYRRPLSTYPYTTLRPLHIL